MLEIVTWPRGAWSIFDELESLQEDMNRALGGQGRERPWRRRMAYPPMNVWSSKDGLVVDVELPGADPKGVEVSVLGDELTIRGKVNVDQAREGETCLRRERPSGDFVRTFQLPFRASAGAVKATSKNGVLQVVIPRSEEEKPRRIAIEAG